MTNSRPIAGVKENHFSSNFLLKKTHDKVDNQFDISHDHLMQINNDEIGNNSDVSYTQNDELNPIHVLHIAVESLDIRSKQDQLSKHFSTLTLS